MFLLPFADEILDELLVLRVRHEGGVDTHLFDLVEEIDPTLIDTLAHETFIGIITHVCDMFEGSFLRTGNTRLVHFGLASRDAG